MAVGRRLLNGNAYAFETVTVANAAKALTTTTWRTSGASDAAKKAFISAEGGSMRYRYDGSDPTTTSGHLLSHGDILEVEGEPNMLNFRAIRVGDRSGTLTVTYEANYG